MFPSPATDFDYPRASLGRRRGCQSASVSVGQDLPKSGCLAVTSVLHKWRRYRTRSPLFSPAGCYAVSRASVRSLDEGLI